MAATSLTCLVAGRTLVALGHTQFSGIPNAPYALTIGLGEPPHACTFSQRNPRCASV